MKRGTKWALFFVILSGILCLTILATAALFWVLWQGSTDLSIQSKGILVFDWQGPLIEVPQLSPLEELLGHEPLTLWQMTQVLNKAKNDPNVVGVVGRVGYLMAGMAKVQELRDALKDFADSDDGKKVIMYSEMGGGKSLYLASAGSEFYVAPTATFEVGLLAEIPFYAKTFEKIGIQADIVAMGKYKAAGEPYTRDSMSPEYRESMEALLSGYHNQILTGIQQGRSISYEEAEEAFDQGLLSASACVTRKLADEAMYGDQLWDVVDNTFGSKLNRISPKDYYNRHVASKWSGGRNKVALIFTEGVIMSGESMQSPFSGPTIGSDTMVKLLRGIRKDGDYKGVILRIDSPGGSGLASDAIWREMDLLRQDGMSVVVSMSDVAASGGYYVSMCADRIVAQPATITGSIGVLAGKFSMRGLYDWAGVNVEQLKRGANSTFFSSYQTFTESEREVLRKHLQEFYHDFVSKAADGRAMGYDALDAVAQGRVWTGEDALNNGLIDRLGGLDAAVDEMKQLIGKKEISLDIYPRRETFWESILEEDKEPVIYEELPEDIKSTLRTMVILDRLDNQGPMALWMDGLTGMN